MGNDQDRPYTAHAVSNLSYHGLSYRLALAYASHKLSLASVLGDLASVSPHLEKPFLFVEPITEVWY